MSYLVKLHLICSGPTILGTLCIIILTVVAIKKGRKWWQIQVCQVACILFSISFVGVSSSALSAFACSENADGSVMLQKDPNVLCSTEDWILLYAAPALFWILVYATACPALFVLYLQKRDRHTLWDNKTFAHQAFAMMYRKFRMDVYAWELVVLTRKFVVVGSVILFNLYVVCLEIIYRLWKRLHSHAALLSSHILQISVSSMPCVSRGPCRKLVPQQQGQTL
jgi:hypothetical protein